MKLKNTSVQTIDKNGKALVITRLTYTYKSNEEFEKHLKRMKEQNYKLILSSGTGIIDQNKSKLKITAQYENKSYKKEIQEEQE